MGRHQLLLALSLTLLGCRGPQRPATAADQLAVLEAVIDSVYGWGSSVRPVVAYVRAETHRYSGACVKKRYRDAYPTVPTDTWDSYCVANARDTTYGPVPSKRYRTMLLAPATDSQLQSGGPVAFWERFYAAYPDAKGLIGFSRIGFDRSAQWAIVRFWYGCGSLCGTGWEQLLRRNADGSWRLVGEPPVRAFS